jgi:ferredoxin
MNIQSMKLVYFSPTRTTKAIIQGIAHGINHRTVELIDITRPDARKQHLHTTEDELLLVAVPVYMGRVPALLIEWLQSTIAHNTPTVCIVVYGNRVYDDALLELTDILRSRGCIPIAAAAYIGEHSFSNAETPIAKSRPDADDLSHAAFFGRKIQEKMRLISSVNEIGEVRVPGNSPYRGDSTLWTVDFIAVSDECVQCGVCADGCPVGAIDPGHSEVIDIKKCITCCACIRNCPKNARTMKPGLVKDASKRLNTLYSERKEPEFFL